MQSISKIFANATTTTKGRRSLPASSRMEKSHDKTPICLPTAHRKCQEQCNSRRVKQNPVNINKREEEENVKYSSSKKSPSMTSRAD
jgi:hypothetical protein